MMRAARSRAIISARAMLGLIDTRGERPDREGRDPLWLDIPELRPWRWYVAAIVCLVVAGNVVSWAGVIAVIAGLGCALYGLTSYTSGNDGLSKHRQ
jgi:hypothetical protein